MSRALTAAATLLALAATHAAAAAPARASGFLVPDVEGASPSPAWSVVSYKVEAVVRGPHARVTVEQAFKNVSGGVLDAHYVFPLPRGAMVSSLTLHDGERGYEGRLLRAQEARRAYEEIVRRRKDPALLRYLGSDIYQVRVFPIPPGETRRLVLRYDQTLTSDSGLVEFLHPISTARFVQAMPQVAVRVDLEASSALGPIYSPTHDVAVTRTGDRRAEISFEGPVASDATDWLLYWSTTTRDVGATLLTYWPADEEQGYFLFLASPSIKPQADRPPSPKSITFVVDTSGSMAGEKIEQVRAALRQVLPALNPGDHFNVIAYHTTVVPLWDAPRPVSEDARKEALAFVEGLRAAGGTHIQGALRTALAAPRARDVPSVVVFLTDGRPTMGETDPDKILAMVKAQNAGEPVRIFVLGVGVDVNTVMLDRLALENRGAPAFVRPRENVEVKVSGLYDKIRYPVLTGVHFAAAGMRASEILPGIVPDLFRGGELMLAGRYAAGGPVRLTLSGRDGRLEREYHYVLTAARKGQGLHSDFPARVWATRRIAELLDAIRLRKEKDPELVGEIVRLSTKFGILTEYTSFLADETGVSHSALGVNTLRTRKILDALVQREVGGAGLAQSANQGSRRGATRAPQTAGAYYLGKAGDRDVERVQLRGVRQVANRTFYYRGGTLGWVDVNVTDARKPEETMTRWSPRFFELLQTTTQDENVRLAQQGPLLLEVQGRVLRIVDQ